MKRAETSSNWSDLPQYILELILRYLIVPDRLRFGSVCHPWCIAQTKCQCLLPQLPLLFISIISGDTRKGAFHSYSFYSLTERKILRVPMPYLKDFCTCVSSSHGWLLFQSNDDLLVSLENAECVRLPKLLKDKFSVFYRDCLFFSTPADPHGVVFIRKSDHTFLLYRRRRKRFVEYEWKGAVASNTIFFEGKLYAFCKDWSLAVFDPLFPGNNVSKLEIELKSNTKIILHMQHCVYVLVESCGEILMVRIMAQYGHSPSCEVFRADLTAMEWVKLEDIGDSTLYLSKTSAISVCASKVGGCKGNHIYYLPRACDGGFDTSKGSYMEFELGSRDGLTIHSVPHNPAYGFSYTSAGAWVTPCLPEFQTSSF